MQFTDIEYERKQEQACRVVNEWVMEHGGVSFATAVPHGSYSFHSLVCSGWRQVEEYEYFACMVFFDDDIGNV